MANHNFKLKEGMVLGVASAATQIEGGNIAHSWNDWAAKGHIKDGTSPSRANNHYELWREDTALLKKLGIKNYRLGIEWARIEPEQGIFDQEAIKHYQDELALLAEAGIRPLVTIHHFTNPMWFEEMGAFTKPENVKFFLAFVREVVIAFGGTVNEYITINEPNVYATFGYFYGEWPPGKKSFFEATKVMSVLVAAHIRAYRTIHRVRKSMGYDDTKVSFANHMRVFDPANPKNPAHVAAAKATERFFQGSLTKAMYKGEFSWPISNVFNIPKGVYCDFIAINYYTRSTVKGIGDGTKEGAPINDLGWEIYPEGIVRCAQKAYNVLQAPIYITENGTCDNTDSFRSRYLYDHIKAICESDLPFEKYYHWCFCDNFEWIEGETPRFGVVKIDYETQKRTIKKSGKFFADMIKNSGVTEEAYEKYVEESKYNVPIKSSRE